MKPRGARGVGPLLTTSLAEQDLNTSLHVSPKLWRSTGRTLTTGTGTPVPVATELKLDTLVQTIITNMKSEIQVLCLIINSVFICVFLVTNGIFERGTQTLNVGRDQCK